MSDQDRDPQPQQQQQQQQSGEGPGAAAPQRRPARSGEGLDSVMTRLREQEDQRVQNDPTIGITGARN